MGIWSGIGKLAAARGGRMGAAVSFLGQRPDLSNTLIGGGIGLATTGSLEGMFTGAGAGYLFGGRKGVARRDRARANLVGQVQKARSVRQGLRAAGGAGTPGAMAQLLKSSLPGAFREQTTRQNMVIAQGLSQAKKGYRAAKAGYRSHSMGRAALGGLGVGGAFFALRSVGNSFGSITSNPHGVTFSGMGQPMYQ